MTEKEVLQQVREKLPDKGRADSGQSWEDQAFYHHILN
jgi:hypothetical protein